jgi:hypothetical protein
MSDWPPESFELCKGPLDGSRVVRTGDVMPQRIWCFRLPYPSGLVLWMPTRAVNCDQCYVMDGFKFRFDPKS